MIQEITATQYETEVLKSDKPVVVIFSAPWCGPCIAMAPIHEEVAKDLTDMFKFVKVNIDTDPDLAIANHVRGIPTMLVVSNGHVIKTKISAISKQQYFDWLTE